VRVKLAVRSNISSLAADRYRAAFHINDGRTDGLIIEADVCKRLVCTLYVAFRPLAHTWPRTAVIICSARNMKLMTPKFSFSLPLDVLANGTASCKGVDYRALLFTAIVGSMATL
jgi:hypothetical protein